MHLVSLALEPAEKSTDAVPAIVFVVLVRVIARALLAFDDEVLIRFWQFLEWNVNIDLFAGAGPEQIFLRFAKLSAAKNSHDALFNIQTAIRNRLVQINRNGSAEPAAFGTRAQRIIETKEAGCWRTNVEIAMRAMPAGGERELVISTWR